MMWSSFGRPYTRQARPEGSDTPQKTSHIQINTANMPNERVKLSAIKLEDVAIDGPKIFLNRVYSMYPYDPPDGMRDEALIDPPPPEDLTPYFNPEDLEQLVETKALLDVAKAFETESEVKWLARKLKLDSPLMNKMTQKYGYDLTELMYQLLLCWQRVYGQKAQVGVLVTALCNSRNQAQCWILKDYLDKARRGEIMEDDGDSKDGSSKK